MKKLTTLFMLFFALYCSAIAQKKTHERIYIETEEYTKDELKKIKEVVLEEDSKNQKSGAAIPELLLPKAVDFTVKQVGEYLTKNAAKYIGQYSTTYVGDNFYELDAGKAYLKIKYFNVIREQDTAGVPKRYSEIKLKPVLSADGTFFKLVMESLQINSGYAEKTKKEANVKITMGFVSKAGSGNSTPIPAIDIENVEYGKQLTFKNLSTTWIKVPDTSGEDSKKLNGSFELNVKVEEVDAYNKRAQAIAAKFSENKDTLGEALKKLLDNKD